MEDFVRLALGKGARAFVTKLENGFYIEVRAYGRILGKYKFDLNKNFIKGITIEKDFYPRELADYELSKVRIYKKRGRKARKGRAK